MIKIFMALPWPSQGGIVLGILFVAALVVGIIRDGQGLC